MLLLADYPKEVDGEDITGEISGRLMQHNRETEKLFDNLFEQFFLSPQSP